MKKSYLLIPFLIILLFSVFITGCQTPKYHTTDSPLLQSDENSGIEVQCLFLDKEAILKRHGVKNNPFLAPPMIATPQPILIFELKINNMEPAPIKLDIRDIEFYYKDKRYRAMSKSQIYDKIDEFGDNGMDKRKQKRVAIGYMLGDIKTIPGNSEVIGYLVFMSGFSDRGTGELVLPFRTIDNLEITDFTFYYNFMLKK